MLNNLSPINFNLFFKITTPQTLSYLNDRILSGFDNGLFMRMNLIDLEKAFDTIDHDIILKNIKSLGFNDSTTVWYNFYLESRYFVVNIENVFFRKSTCILQHAARIYSLSFNLIKRYNCNLVLLLLCGKYFKKEIMHHFSCSSFCKTIFF